MIGYNTMEMTKHNKKFYTFILFTMREYDRLYKTNFSKKKLNYYLFY